jgi:hypothetical protein
MLIKVYKIFVTIPLSKSANPLGVGLFRETYHNEVAV